MGQLKFSVALAMSASADLESVRRTLDSFVEQDAVPRQIQITIYGKQPAVRKLFIERYRQRKDSELASIAYTEVPEIKDRDDALKHAAFLTNGLFLTFWEVGTIYHRNTLSILRAGLVVAGPKAAVMGDGLVALGTATWRKLATLPTGSDRLLSTLRKSNIPIGEVSILANLAS